MTQNKNNSGENSYPHLFSPLRIGNISVRNRLMQTAHAKGFHSGEGLTNNRDIYYQAERAKGGIGLIVTGARHTHPTSTGPNRSLARGNREEIIERDAEMVRAVHEFGGRIIAQIIHFGPQGRSGALDDYRELWGPSTMKSPAYNEWAREMSHEQMREVSEHFALTALNSKAAGFDGVELHFSHGYLHQQFLSFVYNKRTDEYGGTLDNIVRFPIETMQAVRDAVGPDFVVGIRVSMDECSVDGMQADVATAMTCKLVETGLIDYVSATAGTYAAHADQIPPGDYPENWLVEDGARLRKAVRAIRDIPVFIVGHIVDPAKAEALVAEGAADMIAMTRTQIADPEFANKLLQGREDEINHCIRCNQACIARLMAGNAISCVVNPAAGREQRFGSHTFKPAATAANWLVIGGGPAGMRAALELARRGHGVRLVEAGDKLGGQLNLAAQLPRRHKFGFIPRDLERQLRKAGVEISLNTRLSADDIVAAKAHGVIIATGSTPLKTAFTSTRPAVDRVPGTEQGNVFSVVEVLQGTAQLGKRVVLFDEDGGRYALGTAEYLLDRGHEVHLISRFISLAPNLALTLDLPVNYRHVFAKGLRYTLNSWVRHINGNQAQIFNLFTDQNEAVLEADSFIIAAGHRSVDELYQQLQGRVEKLYCIGDARLPRPLQDSIYEAMLAGREILHDPNRFIEQGELEGFDLQWREALISSIP
ncbi:FAD-dependent oxidoreductase [Pseudomonas sp. 5P_3.1_Bac2]|uniref:oxidoreductase n=1 Tax=Pseudomonas sp. 5P_3.1_Bac2 TaxID=2971617 RepID=UPI0021C6CB20|nr:FAD-dependent oxidoreductase [Pseudomonas sp. 5P_3.1_Bac2]MCU1719059.1 FAD-dependent oxidoreductase [Pseudomonas sp. 5P_3.1_Bac2]